MDTTEGHISRRCRPILASAVIVFAALLSLAAHTSAASVNEPAAARLTQSRTVSHGRTVPASYGWPIKPFNRQHPVRGYLNDPRIGSGRSFHFGIDVAAPTGTAVYAVEAGQVFLTPGRMAVAVKSARRTFGYWHVKPAVRNSQFVGLHALIGHVVKDGGAALHVHLAERTAGGRYVNPLRAGGIGPYVDRTPPTVAAVEFLRNGRRVAPDNLRGRVDIVVEVFDTTPQRVPTPWSDLPVTAARIRWSIRAESGATVATRTALNSHHMLPAELFTSVFAGRTTQNHVRSPGKYRYYLARGFDVSRLPDGFGRLRIDASDTRGNRVVAAVDISRA